METKIVLVIAVTVGDKVMGANNAEVVLVAVSLRSTVVATRSSTAIKPL